MRKILSVAMLAMVFAAGQAHAATVESYTAGPAGDAVNLCRQDSTNKTGLNIAAACKSVTGGQSVHVVISDDTFGTTVGYFWEFLDASGSCVGEPADPTAACPNAGFAVGARTFGVPAGSVQLQVLLDGPAFATADGVDFATTGTVSFS